LLERPRQDRGVGVFMLDQEYRHGQRRRQSANQRRRCVRSRCKVVVAGTAGPARKNESRQPARMS
jgi:hypothetical protein